MKELENKIIFSLILVFVGSLFFVSISCRAAETQNTQLRLTGVNADGGLELVWVEGNNKNGYGVYYSRYTNGTWQQKQLMTHSNNLVVTPCIGGSGKQGSMLVWSEKSSNSTDLYYSVYKNGSWSSPQKIETNLVSNLSPTLLVDSNNKTWLAWVGSDGSDDDIYYSTLNGTSWEAPVQVNDDNDTPDIFPVLGMASNGSIWIQWYGWQNGKYRQFREDWNGTSWEEKRTMTDRAVLRAGYSLSESGTARTSTSQNTNTQSSVQLPTFLQHPERATIHVLQSKTGMQTVALRDLYAE